MGILNSKKAMIQQLKDKVSSFLNDYQIVSNAWRKELLCRFVVALSLSRSVQFHKVAAYLNDAVMLKSNTNRIQDFFREVDIDFDALASLLYFFLPASGKLRITIDRTEWDFGRTQVNILMVMVGQGDFQIPLYWELLDNKSGNSSTLDRMELMDKVLKVVPLERVGMVVADREFIGGAWFKYMKDNGLRFCVRVPKHHKITLSSGCVLTVDEVLEKYPKGVKLNGCMVDGVWGSVYIKPLKDDVLYLFGTQDAQMLGGLYRKRWGIEAMFQRLKSRGFNMEESHLVHLERMKKLVGMVALSYAICLGIGLYKHHKIMKIKVKKHGYKANSFFRYGRDHIAEMLRKATRAMANNIVDIVEQAIQFIKFELSILSP